MREWPRRLLVWLIQGYRLLLSPWLGGDCRFEPTCSVYAIEAVKRHGAAAGGYLMLKRIGRCQPWCAGGCDPVPHERPRLFAHLFPESSEKKPS
ncbi:MAG: membrane protein insertion efficiency factor YidD [Polaromonas sp.]|nr:membrane protein insertion efficiency factor YidD [Polaromonas sp.]